MKYKFRTSSTKNCKLYAVYWYIGKVRTSRLFFVKFMTVFVTRRDSACYYLRVVTVSPFKQKTSPETFGIHRSESCLNLIRDVAVKLAKAGFGDNSWLDTRASKFKGKKGTIIHRCFDKNFLQCQTQVI
jgi:hypothetical protein